MRILVSGADGFTGLHFSRAALAAGHDVLPLQGDLADAAGVVQQVRRAQPGAVVHLAAISFVGHPNAGAFYDVNVIGTMNLLSALCQLDHPPDKVLLASSANIYGNCQASPIAETQAPAPVNHYAMSKLAMEHMSRTYLDRLPIVFSRPFNYTGPAQAPNFVIPKIVSHFVQRAPSIALGNLHVEREFNDVRMVCDAYLSLLASGVPGQAYNVCSGQPYSLQQVISALSDITAHTIDVRVDPALVRANEVVRLCGNPQKLAACIGPLKPYPLEATLTWMLDSPP